MRVEESASVAKNLAVAGNAHECRFNLRSERERLKTFDKWPEKDIDPVELVKLGFFYTQFQDEIRCAFCGIQISNWSHECDPGLQHRMFSSSCDFLLNKDCGNIPMEAITSSH